MRSTAYTWKVTKYDPADFDGHYVGTLSSFTDHGPVEASYLDAVLAFARASGTETLTVREPQVAPLTRSWPDRVPAGHVLYRILGDDLSAFHDGAEVSLEAAVELVREMLGGDDGVWCRLEHEDQFFVHIGWDMYMYIGSDDPCEDAVRSSRDAGLFPVEIECSPHAFDQDDHDDVVDRPGDDEFWRAVASILQDEDHLLLEESSVQNASRWHRITRHNVGEVRAMLQPRAMVTILPGMTDDAASVVTHVEANLDDSGFDVVWSDETGTVRGVLVMDAEDLDGCRDGLRAARAAASFPFTVDDRPRLCTATMPDADGVLRARWRPDPAPADRDWAARVEP
ncbi:RNA-binding protein [Antribacter gilvus]|uniref:RNA-binding protein n=1 Tax=Antribacter gilvus TaxID=2304675 RepID=UPI000F789C57|nr:RNA-binding protein [Antribacter gilvus]